MNDYRAVAQRIVETLGAPATCDLLRLRESNDTVRADAFRQLHERGGKDALLDSCTTWRPIRSCVAGWSST